MATLAETWTVLTDPALKEKATSAALAAAQAVLFESDQTANHANRVKWAKSVFENPVGTGNAVVNAVVARWAGEKTLAELNALSDQDIKDAVSAALNTFADGT